MTDKTQEELQELLVKLQWDSGLIDSNISTKTIDKAFRKFEERLTHFINKYYVPKGDLPKNCVTQNDTPKKQSKTVYTLEEVEKIIGEDETIADTPTHPVVSYEALHRNQLRAEQRENIKSIRSEK